MCPTSTPGSVLCPLSGLSSIHKHHNLFNQIFHMSNDRYRNIHCSSSPLRSVHCLPSFHADLSNVYWQICLDTVHWQFCPLFTQIFLMSPDTSVWTLPSLSYVRCPLSDLPSVSTQIFLLSSGMSAWTLSTVLSCVCPMSIQPFLMSTDRFIHCPPSTVQWRFVPCLHI